MHQVEFHIASASYLLPISVFRGILQVLPLLDDGQISSCKASSDICDKGIPILQGSLLCRPAIVEKQTSNSPCFIPVSVPEIGVALLLKIRIEIRVVFITDEFARVVKMHGILFKKIIGGKVLSTTEPGVNNPLLF